VTTIKPYAVDAATGEPLLINGQKAALIGPNGTPLPNTAFVTLAASSLLANGDGIPLNAGGRGTSLPDEVVLDPNEIAIIRERIAAHNRSIAGICKGRNVPLVDIYSLSQELATSGRVVGGVVLTNAFLTGGFYSYDGIHPTDLGHSLIANEWIQVINKSGASIPLVDVSPWLGGRGPGLSAGARASHVPFIFSNEAYQRLLAIFGPIVR
jgi:hypothetical protein